MAVHTIWSKKSDERVFHAIYICSDADQIEDDDLDAGNPPDGYRMCKTCRKALKKFLKTHPPE